MTQKWLQLYEQARKKLTLEEVTSSVVECVCYLSRWLDWTSARLNDLTFGDGDSIRLSVLRLIKR